MLHLEISILSKRVTASDSLWKNFNMFKGLNMDVVSCRKKRKWDQPAEAVAPAAYPVSAMPGIVPFGGAGHLASLGMPNMLASLVGVFPTMTLPMPLVSYTSSPSTAPNNVAAAIVQKINQVPLLFDQKHYAWLVARINW
jgi:hypothetical protein